MRGAFTGSVLVLLLLVSPTMARAGLFDREDEDVAAGSKALAEGSAEEALRRYGAAAERHGDAPEVAYDRGAALLAAGKADEALQAFGEAIARRDGGVASAADHAGVGTALAALGRVNEAKAALQRALELDPGQATARRNLEALLRRQQHEQDEQQQEQQAGDEQQQEQQAGDEQRQEQQAGDEQQQEQRAGGEQQQEQQAGDEQQQEQQAGDEQQQASAANPNSSGADPDEANEAAPIDRTRAQQLLDALQAGERPYQLYRRQRELGGRTANDKDW